MATIVASRYAVLSIDDDVDPSLKRNKIVNKKQGAIKPQNTTTKTSDASVKKKKKSENTQALSNKNQNKPINNGSSKKKKEPTEKQWEEWKEKDTQFVDENYEEDLSKAIFLSKLEYEQNKNKVNKGEDKKSLAKKNKKGQKVMTLSEFNNFDSNNKQFFNSKSIENGKSENKLESVKKLSNKIPKEELVSEKKVDPNNEEALTLVLYETCIQKKDREISQLKSEVERLNIQFKTEIERLNTQLKNVKTRNTQLCQIIANGEMKDKAEVLMEVERLQLIKDELSSEVASLHIQLEQERSKVRQLSMDHKSKEKNKKQHTQKGQFSETQKGQT